MISQQQELAEALAQLQDAPRFRVYLRTLSAAKEAAIQRLLSPATDAAEVHALRGEARAYNDMLKALKRNGVPHVEASSSDPPGEAG